MTTLSVALDATAVPARLTGAGVYTARLAAELANRGDLDVHVFAAPHATGVLDAPGVHLHPTPLAGRHRALRIAWTQARSGAAARRVGAQILHGIHYELPLRAPRLAQVVTVHDLTLVTHPQWHEASKVTYFRWAMRRAVARADRILCVSASTARDLTRTLDVDPGRVDVTPLGTDLTSASDADVRRVRTGLGLSGPYLLGLGTLEPRKDLPTLISAFARVAGDIPHDLVLAGLPGWGTGPLADTLARSGVADRIRLAGYVPEVDKAALYTGADVFVYPSRYEGFGLPVLEAMACGVPVVTTTGGSLPEVAGDAAVTVTPGDVPAVADALTGILGDQEQRALLVQRGRERAGRMRWSSCAELTAAAYRTAVARYI